jgi:hypothetical protein
METGREGVDWIGQAEDRRAVVDTGMNLMIQEVIQLVS